MGKPKRTAKQIETRQKADAHEALRVALQSGRWFVALARVDEAGALRYDFVSHDFPDASYAAVGDDLAAECDRRLAAAGLKRTPKPPAKRPGQMPSFMPMPRQP